MIYLGLMNQTPAIPFLYSTGGLDKSSPYKFILIGFDKSSPYIKKKVGLINQAPTNYLIHRGGFGWFSLRLSLPNPQVQPFLSLLGLYIYQVRQLSSFCLNL